MSYDEAAAVAAMKLALAASLPSIGDALAEAKSGSADKLFEAIAAVVTAVGGVITRPHNDGLLVHFDKATAAVTFDNGEVCVRGVQRFSKVLLETKRPRIEFDRATGEFRGVDEDLGVVPTQGRPPVRRNALVVVGETLAECIKDSATS